MITVSTVRTVATGVCAVLVFGALPTLAWAQGTQAAGAPGTSTMLTTSTPFAPRGLDAEIRIFATGGQAAARGTELVNGATASLCVTSTTGRFRMRVASQSGGAMVSPRFGRTLPYSVTFRDPTGVEQTSQMTGQDLVFEGRSRPDMNCRQGSNATLSIRSSDRDINAAVAGDYLEQLRLSVEPL